MFPGVAAVVGNSHKALAPQIIFDLVASERSPSITAQEIVPVHSLLGGNSAPVWADDRFAHSFLEEASLAPGKQTRPNLKIQEGCGNRCTFCVIPITRGPSRSLRRESVLRRLEDFVAAGGNELVLSGINLGRWGRESRNSERDSLGNLVRSILECTALPRLRLSSIEPMDWDDELVELLHEHGGGRLCRHAHLPLQSGSDAVLRRMHRRYRPWHYADKVAALVQAAGSSLTIGADVMVGFPGETDREFEQTLDFVRALPFGYLHLFPFSPRPGTPGWDLHAKLLVPTAAVEERMDALRALAVEKARTHRIRFVGRELPAITLQTPASLAARGCTEAITDNFIPVELDGEWPANQLFTARITRLNSDGELVAYRTC